MIDVWMESDRKSCKQVNAVTIWTDGYKYFNNYNKKHPRYVMPNGEKSFYINNGWSNVMPALQEGV